MGRFHVPKSSLSVAASALPVIFVAFVDLGGDGRGAGFIKAMGY
jgi:hypothetical protein